MWLAVFLAWVPFRAADIEAPCSRATAPSGTGAGRRRRSASSSAAAVLVLVDLFRVPLLAPPPALAAGWRGWAWLGRGTLWAAAGVAVASVTHLFWGAAEKAFIYFRF